MNGDAGAARRRPDAASSRRLRLLAVEDNPEMQKLFTHFLAPQWDVDPAWDMESALQMASETAYDAVLMDINLGNKATGVDVLRALRGLPHYAGTPIIAVTAYALPGDRERFLGEGFDAYIGKPFGQQDLVGTLDGALAA